MATATDTRTVTIDLERVCLGSACAQMAQERYDQLSTVHYSRAASVLPMPESVEAWRADHRTARKRADRAERLYYRFDTIDRSQHNDPIHAINVSLPERQGRPMSEGYVRRRNHGGLPTYECDRHRLHTYGVLDQADTLVAYLTLHRCGQLGLVSMILGHGDHLDAGIMYLLVQGTIADQLQHAGSLYYNVHSSGRAGLAWMKERLGFLATDIEWRL